MAEDNDSSGNGDRAIGEVLYDDLRRKDPHKLTDNEWALLLNREPRQIAIDRFEDQFHNDIHQDAVFRAENEQLGIESALLRYFARKAADDLIRRQRAAKESTPTDTELQNAAWQLFRQENRQGTVPEFVDWLDVRDWLVPRSMGHAPERLDNFDERTAYRIAERNRALTDTAMR